MAVGYKRNYKRKSNYSKKGKYTLQKYKGSYSIPLIAPDKKLVKLPYNISGLTILTGGFERKYVMNLNNLYDTNGTESGTQQPMGFDEYEAFYQYYTVYGCKIMWRFYTPAGTDPVEVAIVNNFAGTVATSLDQAKETKGSRSAVILPGIKPVVITQYVDLKKLFGGTDLQDNRYRAAFSGEPANVATTSMYSRNLDGSSEISLHYDIRYVYYAKLDTMNLADRS